MTRVTSEWSLWFGETIDTTMNAETVQKCANYDYGWMNPLTEPMVDKVARPIQGAQDWTYVTNQVDAIKAINPATKIGVYVAGSVAFARGWDPAYPWTTASERLHRPDGSEATTTTADGVTIYRWIDYGSPEIRARHAALYLDFFAETHLDGIMLDSWLDAFYAINVAADPASANASPLGCPGGLLEGPLHETAYWTEQLPRWTGQLTETFAPYGYEVMTNGAGEAVATSVIDETFQNVINSPAAFAAGLSAVTSRLPLGARVFCWTQPSLLGFSPVRDENLFRFYLTAYLLVQEPGRTSFGYHDQQPYFGWDVSGELYIFWHDDLGRDYGDAVAPVYLENGLYVREYTAGVVAVNPTEATGYQFRRPGTYRIWGQGPIVTIGPGDADDTTVSGVSVPPRGGIWFETARAS